MFKLGKGKAPKNGRCMCGMKVYEYERGDLRVSVCYKCGRFNVNAHSDAEELMTILAEDPETLLYLIESRYLEPI